MTKRLLSRATSTGRTTKSAPVRLAGGDSVAVEIARGTVAPGKAGPLDRAFLKLAETAFEEWNSPGDEAAFRLLQRCAA
jgi:hypothetical protein